MSDYKRLTKQAGWHKDIDLKDELGYSYIYQRLAELENKIEQGTLIEFPRIVKTKNLDAEYYVEIISDLFGGVIDCYECDTREEAKEKLKELKNGRN